MRVFVDTNLWVYRLDRRESAKRDRVSRWLRELISEHEVVISTQVLIELRAVLSTKLRPVLSSDAVGQVLAALSQFEVVGCDAALIQDAHDLAATQQLSWFDALIVEAALRSRCEVLYSEDLATGRRFASLQVRNPL